MCQWLSNTFELLQQSTSVGLLLFDIYITTTSNSNKSKRLLIDVVYYLLYSGS